MTVTFPLDGQEFMGLNGGPEFKFEEIDGYWDKLIQGGGRPVECGWLTDRFGLSWQIVPTMLFELLKDPAKSDRVMKALVSMVKLDIRRLKEASEG